MSIRTHSGPWVFWGTVGWLAVSGCSGATEQPETAGSTQSSSDDKERTSGLGTGTTTSPSATTSSTGAPTSSSPTSSEEDAAPPRIELMWDNLTYPCSLRDGGDFILTCDRRQYLGDKSRVLSLPKGGGAPTTLFELPAADAVAITDAIWTLDGTSDQLLRFDLNNPAAQYALQAPYYTSGLFSAGAGVLATSYEGISWYPDGAVAGTSLWSDGADEEVWLVAATDSSVYLTLNPPYPAPRGSAYKVLGLDVDFAAGTVLGAPRELDSGIGSAKGIALTPTAVIFADNHNDKLYSVPQAGGARTLLADVQYPWSVGVNSTHVYIASRPEECTAEGAVYRVPLAGGPLETIASQQVCPSNIVVTESEVYWLNAGPEQPDGDPPMVSGSYASIMRAVL